MEITLIKYLDHFRRLGNAPAYVQQRGFRTYRWSYLEVARAACRFARELEARKIAPGDRVLLWGENCAEWVCCFLGCLLRGAVAVPMDWIASPDFALKVSAQVEARLVVCSRELAQACKGIPLLLLEEFAAAIGRHDSAPYEKAELRRQDPIEIVFTSGTTADPKGVVITHANVLANLEPFEAEIAKYMKYERFVHPLRFLNLLPLSHVFGQFLGVFIPQLLGSTVVFNPSLNPSEIVATIKRERISVLVAVPRMLESLKDKIERDCAAAGRPEWLGEQFPRSEHEHFLLRMWRFRGIHRQFGWKFWAVISGGAALEPDTERFWSRLGFAVIQGYGLTETTSLISVNHPMRLSHGSIGKVLPGRELKLSPEGEILVRGANVASAYFQGGKLKPVSGDEGWFHTGDMGAIDGQGNLFFKGRRKNVIVTPEGLNVYPEDLEGALKKEPEVKDCVVIGIELGGNAEPCAILILRDGKDAAEVVKRANAGLADYQQIRRWYQWPEEDFPRTATQKPKLDTIRRQLEQETAGRESKASSGALRDLLARVTRRPLHDVSPDATLAQDLNLTSIERVELLSALEDRFQVDINETRFSSATTLRDLERMLHEPVARRTDYHYPRWARRWPIAALRFVVYYLLTWPATCLMAKPEVRGREHLKAAKGPLLIVCNHITRVDVGFVLFALPFRFRHRLAVAMLGEMLEEMLHPLPELGWWKCRAEQLSYWLVVTLFNVFPLPQRTGFRESFAFAGECADRGHSIIVFPEGQRTLDGRLAPFRAGIGMLARDLRLPVLPVRIDGLYELKLRNQKFARPGRVCVTLGRPMTFEADAGAEAITAKLEEEMRTLAVGGR